MLYIYQHFLKTYLLIYFFLKNDKNDQNISYEEKLNSSSVKNLFPFVKKINSIDLSNENILVSHSLEFIKNNFNLKVLKITKLKIFGFPYNENRCYYFENLQNFIENHKSIFYLNKIFINCQTNDTNFFSKFKNDEFYKLVTNFFQILFSLMKNSCEIILNFLKFENSNSFNELYFYVYCLLGLDNETLKKLKFIKILHIFSKNNIFKYLNVDKYKKFIKEFMDIKCFRHYKYQNNEHLLKIYSRANYNNIKITGEITKNFSNKDIYFLTAKKNYANKLNFLNKDAQEFREAELEEENYTNNDFDSKHFENFNDIQIPNDEQNYNEYFEERVLKEISINGMKNIDYIHAINKNKEESIINQNDDSFNYKNEKSCSFDHDFNENIIFDDDYDSQFKIYNMKNQFKYDLEQIKLDLKNNELNISEKNKLKDFTDLNRDNEYKILNDGFNKNYFNKKDRDVVNNFASNQSIKELQQLNSSYDYTKLANDYMNDCGLPIDIQLSYSKDLKQNEEYLEIKKHSKLYENIFFKIKSSLKKKKGIIILTKNFNKLYFNNLINIELYFDNRFNNNLSKQKNFLGNFPTCLKSIKFDFFSFENFIIEDILNNIICNDLKNIIKLIIKFEYLNLSNLHYHNNDKTKKFHFENSIIDDDSNIDLKKYSIIDIENLNNSFIQIMNNNKNITKFEFLCDNFIILNERSVYDKMNTDALCIYNEFSKIRFGNFIGTNLFFISKLFFQYLIKKIKNEKFNLDIKLDLIASQETHLFIRFLIEKNYDFQIKKIQLEKYDNDLENLDLNLSNDKKINNNNYIYFDDSLLEFSEKCMIEINRANFIDFLNYFNEFELNSEEGIFLNENLKKLNLTNINKKNLNLLSKHYNFNKLFYYLNKLENLSLKFSTEEHEDMIHNKYNIFNNISDKFREKNKINEEDFKHILDLFNAKKHNKIEDETIINDIDINSLIFKNIRKLKFKLINVEENECIEKIIEYLIMSKNNILQKLVIQGDISDYFLENLFGKFLNQYYLFKCLSNILIQCKMQSGFNELYDNYHSKIYNNMKNLVQFDFINTYI